MSIQDIATILSIPSVITVLGWIILWRRQTALERVQILRETAVAAKTKVDSESVVVDSALDVVKTLREEMSQQKSNIIALQVDANEKRVLLVQLQQQVEVLQRERLEILQGVRLLIGQLEEKGIIPVWRPKVA